MNWDKLRVLVTGCSGFLGAAICRTLLDRGASVIGIDPAGGGSPCLTVAGLAERLPVAMHPARQLPDGAYGAEVVIHLAGMSHIRACADDPAHAWNANVTETWWLLEALRRAMLRPSAIVIASSNHAYGPLPVERETWTEDDPLGALDVYGASKAMQDRLGAVYAAQWGLPIIALRHANAYGPGDPHESHLVTGMLRGLARGERPKLRSDGTSKKGYLYVDDVVSAYLVAVEAAANGVTGGLNVYPEHSISAFDLARMCLRVAGLEGDPEVGPPSASSGYREHLSSERIRKLGWNDKVPLYGGLTRTLEWERQHKEWPA